MSEPTSEKASKTEAGGNPSKPAKAQKAKAAKQARPAKEPRPKKERVPREDAVVFAFRLSEAERDTIHKAAGPAKASRFVLGAALAAANADHKAFDALVSQAKANLK